MEIRRFFERFNLQVTNTDYYKEALTHNSYANEHNLNYTYQRLEFLGDAILSKEISLYLFSRFPEKNEGQITSLRSKIVRENTLAEVSRNIGLGNIVRLGKGEIKTQGYDKDRILADIYESIIAAIYLDLGEDAVRTFLHETLIELINESDLLERIRDYKTELQEFLQAENKQSLEYILVDERKELYNHANVAVYEVEARLNGVLYGTGKGRSKKEAEQRAASDVLTKLAVVGKNESLH